MQYLYHAGKLIVKALPKMVKAATDLEFRRALDDHFKESKAQLDRLEKIFDILELKPKGKKSRGIEGLIGESREIMDKSDHIEKDAMDGALIGAAHRIEYDEIVLPVI